MAFEELILGLCICHTRDGRDGKEQKRQHAIRALVYVPTPPGKIAEPVPDLQVHEQRCEAEKYRGDHVIPSGD